MRTFRFSIMLILVFSVGTAYMQREAIGSISTPFIGWSERGMFVFGSLVLDFKMRVAVFGIERSALTDCSQQQFFCASSGLVSLVVPRKCSEVQKLTLGSKIERNGVQTEVLAIYSDNPDLQKIHPVGSGTIFLLGNSNFPHVVYQYDPATGVQVMFLDIFKRMDLVRLARGGHIREALEKMGLRMDLYENDLVTLDPFGQCEQ